MAFSIMTLSIECRHADCRYPEYHNYLNAMLSAFMLNVVVLSFVVLNAIMLSVVTPKVHLHVRH
jgi:hypothetical protein